ncbi:helix-turn-helix domain-containing protein [Streptomyces sp. NPDC085529]|uniref:helix-turn-helix domain-containing protein n=1 Tax=Streptomyces sp. NPDC085529 TaxID=3365729 RepID=UPI0037D1751F
MHSDDVDAETGAVAVAGAVDHGSDDGQAAAGGWEEVRPGGAPAVPGVRMAGFRDRVGQALDLRVLPQPAVIVVIGLGDEPFTVEGGTAQGPSTSARRHPGLVASLSPGPTRIHGRDVECIEMCLSPGTAYALLGVPPHELHGAVVGLEDLWGRQERQLRERVAATAAWQERFTLVSEFLVRRAARGRSISPEVAGVWDTIVARGGRVRVDDLAASCGWSRKRLWSRFHAQIGLTPKRAAMLVRFDRAAQALRAGGNAADVALAHGYADQSHLHRDVHAFAGCTPTALAGL